jgi:two-component system, response regulator PdtaR
MNAPGIKADEGYRGDLNAANFLNGKTILLVEDEFLLALQLEDLLQSRGGTVLGPFPKLDEAMRAAQREDFAFAILDINLNGTMVYPLADDLLARGIPFLFLSGYSLSNLPERFRAVTRLNKPCDPALLLNTLRARL